VSKIILWFTGQSEWRSMITAIWYERTRLILGTQLYNGLDGLLRVRYRREIRSVRSDMHEWIPFILNEVLEGEEESLSFVDMGIEGEYELREWLKGGKHRHEVFESGGVNNIVMHWGSGQDIRKIRTWYRGNLGIFNQKAFEENLYYEDLVAVKEDWHKKEFAWSEIVKQYKNIQRGKLKFAEDHIILNLLRTLDRESRIREGQNW